MDAPPGNGTKVLFLHHSTGNVIWNAGVREWFEDHNQRNGTDIGLVEQSFPKRSSYGWHNYPYDYWKIWVSNGGEEPYMREPTLEMISKQYDVVVWKHCFPVSKVQADTGEGVANSEKRTLENYKLQYNGLMEKMLQFPNVKFLVWTGAALVEDATTPEEAERASDFFSWVKDDWDRKGDNIYIWDFHELETAGGLYLREEYSRGGGDSHPNDQIAEEVMPYLCQRILDVVEDRADLTSLTGRSDT
ncbi:MAG: hypothetical protein KAH57_05410 [Thermoplasmata archaeon]|nr:hypothetical protein [Thermoplasmata archaeon]